MTRAQAAVVLEKGRQFEILDVDVAEPRQDEVLIRVRAVGVCHTDMSMQAQELPVPFPHVFGHEASGIVEAVGSSVTKVAPGDHVVIGFASCGTCRPCHTGLPSYCTDYFGWNFGGGRRDGTTSISGPNGPIASHFFGQSSFAEYCIAYERNVVPVSKDVPLNILGPLGCGIQTGAGAVLRSLKVEAGSSLVVFGAGGVGLSAIMAAKLAGAGTVIAVDVNPDRLGVAKELGADHAIAAGDEAVSAHIQDLTQGGANYSLDTTGRPDVLALAVDVLAVTGTCGAIGGSPVGTTAPINMNNLLFGRTLRGICEGDSVPDVFIPQLIDFFVAGRFPFDRLITNYAFDRINEAAADALSGRVIKPVLTF